LDDIIVFHQLSKTDLMQIVDLEVEKVVGRLKAKDVAIVMEESAKEFLIEKGYDPTYGARPMRRAVERYMEDPLAEELLRGNVKAHDVVHVTAGSDGKLAFNAAEPHGSQPASAS
jgi:ATP-dependent Clp protease ATP-binding subunit ClpC